MKRNGANRPSLGWRDEDSINQPHPGKPSAERVWIDPGTIRFRRDEDGVMCADWDGRSGAVLVNRLFPLTAPDSAVRVGERPGSEWGTLRSLHGLDPESLDVLNDELRLSPFLPRIKEVLSLQRRFGEFRWMVESDAGELAFRTGPVYEAVIALPSGERVVVDLDEQRYVLPRERETDRQTSKKLAKWL